MFSVPMIADAVRLTCPFCQGLADGIRSLRQRFCKHMGVDIFCCPGVVVVSCGRKISADMMPEELLKADYPAISEGAAHVDQTD